MLRRFYLGQSCTSLRSQETRSSREVSGARVVVWNPLISEANATDDRRPTHSTRPIPTMLQRFHAIISVERAQQQLLGQPVAAASRARLPGSSRYSGKRCGGGGWLDSSPNVTVKARIKSRSDIVLSTASSKRPPERGTADPGVLSSSRPLKQPLSALQLSAGDQVSGSGRSGARCLHYARAQHGNL